MGKKTPGRLAEISVTKNASQAIIVPQNPHLSRRKIRLVPDANRVEMRNAKDIISHAQVKPSPRRPVLRNLQKCLPVKTSTINKKKNYDLRSIKSIDRKPLA